MYRAHILPAADLHIQNGHGPRVLELSSSELRQAIHDGFSDFLNLWRAPIIREHTPAGKALGHVVGFELADGGLFAYVQPTEDDELGAEIESRRAQFVSVGFDMDQPDSTGTVRPFALYELSIVDIPAFTVGQQPLRRATAEEIARVSAVDLQSKQTSIAASHTRRLYTTGSPGNMHTKAGKSGSSTLAGDPAQTSEVQVDEEAKAQMTAIVESLAALESRIAAIEAGMVEAGAEEVAGDMAEAEVESEELANMEAENYALRKAIGNPALAPLVGTMAKLARISRAECDKLADQFVTLSASPSAPAPAKGRAALPKIDPVVIQSYGAREADGQLDRYSLARKIQSDALAKGERVGWSDAIQQAIARGAA